MFQVYFTNFGYFSDRQFKTLEEAVAYAKSTTFDATILQEKNVVGAYSYFSGFRNFRS